MSLFNQEFATALGYTLLHSIWQATLIALIMSFVLGLIKREYANKRYIIAVSSLFLCYFVSIFTFYHLYNPGSPTLLLGAEVYLFEDYGQVVLMDKEQGWIDLLNLFLSQNLKWITMAWMLGMLLFLIKILFGLSINRSIAKKAQNVNVQWLENMLHNLQEKALFRRLVEIKSSAKIHGPSVIGWIKPCIYLPIGLVNNIKAEEAEALLAHELAHIIRYDYLVNIFQSVIEALFYFHPAVWWISANIRNERENACDDLAIDIIGDKIKYAKSLVFLQEWENANNPSLAMGLSHGKTPLFERIKRILNQPKNRNEMRQKMIASLILLSSIIWISAGKAYDSPEENYDYSESLIENEMNLENDYNELILDTIPEKNKNKSTIIEIKNGEITRLEIDGKVIPKEKYDEHSALVKQLNREESREEERMVREEMRETMEIERERMEEMREEMSAKREEQREEMHRMMDVEREKMEEMRELMHEQKSVQREEVMKEMELQREEMEEMRERVGEQSKEEREQMEQNMEKARAEMEEMRERMENQTNEEREEMMKKMEKARAEMAVMREKMHEKQMLQREEMHKMMEIEREKMHKMREEMHEKKKKKGSENDEGMSELYEDFGNGQNYKWANEYNAPKFNYTYFTDDTIKINFDSLVLRVNDFEFDFPDMADEVKVYLDSLDFPSMAKDVQIYLDSLDFTSMAKDVQIYLDSLDFSHIGDDIKIMMDSLKFPEFDHHFDFNNNDVESRFITEMKEDGTYKDGRNEINLNFDKLIINGERQSDDQLRKYKNIYEEATGTKLLSGSSINFEIEDSRKKYNYKKI